MANSLPLFIPYATMLNFSSMGIVGCLHKCRQAYCYAGINHVSTRRAIVAVKDKALAKSLVSWNEVYNRTIPQAKPRSFELWPGDQAKYFMTVLDVTAFGWPCCFVRFRHHANMMPYADPPFRA